MPRAAIEAGGRATPFCKFTRKFVVKAPRKTIGQKRKPKRAKTPIPSPASGQTADAFACVRASRSDHQPSSA